jgi:hypothetical protein
MGKIHYDAENKFGCNEFALEDKNELERN